MVGGSKLSLRVLKKALRRVLRTKPRKFQAQGIQFLEEAQGRAILGDDMGLGKTLQVIGFLALHPELRPAIVTCPASAKYEWEDQILEHTRHMKCEVLQGRTPYPVSADILIINYDILPFWEAFLLKNGCKVLAMDECHYVKTRNIKRTKTCKKLSRKASAIIPMSGTPIINRPVEFFPVLNMISPSQFRSFWKYAFRYCKPTKGFNGKGFIFNGSERGDELHKRVAPIMIRRMKSEVLTELPPKQRIRISVDLDNRKSYRQARDNFLKWYEGEHGKAGMKRAEKAVSFVRIGVLKQLAAQGKLKAAYAWIDDFLETTGEKLVVFCYYREVFDQLVQRYHSIAAVGGKSGEKRKLEVRRFQSDNKVKIYIGSIRADREAITLTAASTVLFIEMGWTSGEHDQAEDRVNRIGQMADHIRAYYLIARDSIDEYVWDLIEKKRKVLAQILDGEEVEEKAKRRVSVSALIRNIYRKDNRE